jgi:hypothetical protein
VLDCINDKLEKYLIIPRNNDASAGHSYYHENLFNYRNPLASDDDYHKRCCNRFVKLVESQNNYCFLITLINEQLKRVDWATGFTNKFDMPEYQRADSSLKCITFKQL